MYLSNLCLERMSFIFSSTCIEEFFDTDTPEKIREVIDWFIEKMLEFFEWVKCSSTQESRDFFISIPLI